MSIKCKLLGHKIHSLRQIWYPKNDNDGYESATIYHECTRIGCGHAYTTNAAHIKTIEFFIKSIKSMSPFFKSKSDKYLTNMLETMSTEEFKTWNFLAKQRENLDKMHDEQMKRMDEITDIIIKKLRGLDGHKENTGEC